MRTLFGALVGMLLGVALMAVITSAFNIQNYWPILLAGLIAGLAMRKLASDNHTSYLRGGLAALVTVLAMIGGPFVGAKLISQKAPSITKVESLVTDSGEETAKAGTDSVLEATELSSMPAITNAKGVIGSPKGQENPLDVVLIVAGCLIAYQLGKGPEAVAKVTDPDEESPEPADEEAKQETSEEA